MTSIEKALASAGLIRPNSAAAFEVEALEFEQRGDFFNAAEKYRKAAEASMGRGRAHRNLRKAAACDMAFDAAGGIEG